jgi:TonB family protein
MNHKHAWTTLLLILLGASVGKASDRNTAEKQLKQDLENKVLSLRMPSASEKLQFDSGGQQVGTPLPAPWPTGGLLHLKEVSLKRSSLRIDCERVLLAWRINKASSGPPEFVPVLTGRPVQLTLDLGSAQLDVDHIKAALAKIFEEVDAEKRIAAYWKPAPEVAPNARPSDNAQIVGTLEGSRPVYRVSAGVVEPPKTVSAPDPEYTEEAEDKHIQGTAVLTVVVNEKGMPEILGVVKGLDAGLDRKAVAAVSGWRFKPAILAGQPVAVMTNVEVTFRLPSD